MGTHYTRKGAFDVLKLLVCRKSSKGLIAIPFPDLFIWGGELQILFDFFEVLEAVVQFASSVHRFDGFHSVCTFASIRNKGCCPTKKRKVTVVVGIFNFSTGVTKNLRRDNFVQIFYATSSIWV